MYDSQVFLYAITYSPSDHSLHSCCRWSFHPARGPFPKYFLLCICSWDCCASFYIDIPTQRKCKKVCHDSTAESEGALLAAVHHISFQSSSANSQMSQPWANLRKHGSHPAPQARQEMKSRLIDFILMLMLMSKSQQGKLLAVANVAECG